MIETVVFDMGNVLVHFSHERMCAQIGALCGRSAGEIRTVLMDSGLNAEFERGFLNPEEMCDRLSQAVGQELDMAALAEAYANIFTLNEPMLSILDALRDQGKRLVLLSNTSVWHYDFIWDRFPILQKLDEFVLSYRVGAIKPELPIFHAVVAALFCPVENAFYTDDIADYVRVGHAHGLQAEIFTDAVALRSHLADRGVLVP
ncbi:MAG: HAD family phosphatase [Planctomycetaceae bacterium]|nr:HAD family phosphatase [Planctomycetaceae bacterium]